MIEIPESATIGKQASETLKGKRIAHVIESNSPHRFTFYNGDPAEYSNRLVGRTVLGAQGYGAFVDILMDADTHLLIGDGTNMRYYTSAELSRFRCMVPSTLSKASLTIPITKVASISYVRWTRDSIKPISLVSSGISRKIYPQRRCSPPSNVFRAWATESAKISCSMPGSPRNEKYRLYQKRI